MTAVILHVEGVNNPMHVSRNSEVRSCNHCYSGKAISITYSECVFVALGIQHARHMRHSHLWPVRLYPIFPHCLINNTVFEKKFLNVKCMF